MTARTRRTFEPSRDGVTLRVPTRPGQIDIYDATRTEL